MASFEEGRKPRGRTAAMTCLKRKRHVKGHHNCLVVIQSKVRQANRPKGKPVSLPPSSHRSRYPNRNTTPGEALRYAGARGRPPTCHSRHAN